MRTRDTPETDTRVVDAPDVPGETVVPPQRAAVLDNPEKRREASADSQQHVDGNAQPDAPFKVNRDELARFDLKRAGLPDMSVEDAAKYVSEHRAARPWLAMTDRASPEATRIIAAMDAAGGHAHVRHEGWVSEGANKRRVAYLEDPAQLDPEKRSQGIDGLAQKEKPHWCAGISTRIADPDAFATAFVRGIERPQVQKALASSFNPDERPDPVTLPISDLLGSEGYRHCTGWRLETGDGSMAAARKNRAKWLDATAKGVEPSVPEPRAIPVPTFEDGLITFVFKHNYAEKRYEVASQYADPFEY